MEAAMTNPFVTGFGIVPGNYAQRKKETESLEMELNKDSSKGRVFILTGVRGCGKTVFLTYISSLIEKKDDWVVAYPGFKDNLLEDTVWQISQSLKNKGLLDEKEILKSADPVCDLLNLSKIIRSAGKKLLITVNGADDSEPIKELGRAWESLKDYPVSLLLGGTYESILLLKRDKILDPFWKAPRIVLGPLSMETVSRGYMDLLGVNQTEADKLSVFTKGYPYAYQVVGYLLFKSGKTDLDDSVMAEFDEYMQSYVYSKIFKGLSGRERQIVEGFRSDEPVSVKELKERTGIEDKAFGVYRDRLIKKGVIYSPAYGFLELSLPRFSEYLKSNYAQNIC